MKAARDSLLDLDGLTDEELAHLSTEFKLLAQKSVVNDLSEIQK